MTNADEDKLAFLWSDLRVTVAERYGTTDLQAVEDGTPLKIALNRFSRLCVDNAKVDVVTVDDDTIWEVDEEE
jgi:hypothetical protein